MKSKKYDGHEIFSLPPGFIIIAIDPASGVDAHSFVMDPQDWAKLEAAGYHPGPIVYAREGELDLHSLDEALMADLGWIRNPAWKAVQVGEPNED